MTPAQRRIFGLVLEERALIRALVMRSGFRDVEDGVQLALIAAWNLIRADRLVIAAEQDAHEAVRAWLVIVTRNALSTPRRKQRTDAEELDEGLAADVSPIAQLEAREALRIITYSLNREERATLEALATGASLVALAARMGIPEGTLFTRVRKLRRILRERLAK